MKAFLYFTITAMFWGLNFHLAKMMLQEAHFMEAGFWRYFFGVALLGLIAFKNLPAIKDVRKNISGIVLVGVVCLFGFNFFFFLGMMYSPAINGSLIVSLTPALTLLFSNRLLHTRLRTQELIGVSISFLGVLYLILKGDIGDLTTLDFNWGDIFLLFSATFFALQNVWSKKFGGQLSNINFTFFTNLFCLFSFLILLPFIGGMKFIGFTTTFWLSAMMIGCFGTALAYYLWNKGIQLTSANQAGIFINVVPLSTAAFSFLLGEALFGYHLVSGILIIIGVIVLMNRSLQ